MWDDTEDLDLPLLAVLWCHAASVALARVEAVDADLQRIGVEEKLKLTQGDFWLQDADAHFALVALAHLTRICDLEPRLPAFPESETLALVRNFIEHWDDPQGRSGRTLGRNNFDPLSVGVFWTAKNRFVSDRWNADIRAWLSAVDTAARSMHSPGVDPIPLPTDPVERLS